VPEAKAATLYPDSTVEVTVKVLLLVAVQILPLLSGSEIVVVLKVIARVWNNQQVPLPPESKLSAGTLIFVLVPAHPEF
jgi:hypothetical protein